MAMELRHLAFTANSGTIRAARYRGRDHIIVPVVALMEGVIHAVNAATPEFVPVSELANAPQGWNGRPVVPGHPAIGSTRISANEPSVLESSKFGTVFNSRIKGNKLLMEAWLDKVRAAEIGGDAQRVIERLAAGGSVEVSVGAFVSAESGDGAHNGKNYKATWRNIIPDHLAMLPEGTRGACSIEMGCGAPRSAEEAQMVEELRDLDKDEHGYGSYPKGETGDKAGGEVTTGKGNHATPPVTITDSLGRKLTLVTKGGKWVTRDTGIAFTKNGEIKRLPYATYKRGDEYRHIAQEDIKDGRVQENGDPTPASLAKGHTDAASAHDQAQAAHDVAGAGSKGGATAADAAKATEDAFAASNKVYSAGRGTGSDPYGKAYLARDRASKGDHALAAKAHAEAAKSHRAESEKWTKGNKKSPRGAEEADMADDNDDVDEVETELVAAAALSYSDLRERLNDAISEVTPGFICVESVFTDDTVVYSVGDAARPYAGPETASAPWPTPVQPTLYRRSFKLSGNDIVLLADDPVEVEPVTTYEPVGAQEAELHDLDKDEHGYGSYPKGEHGDVKGGKPESGGKLVESAAKSADSGKESNHAVHTAGGIAAERRIDAISADAAKELQARGFKYDTSDVEHPGGADFSTSELAYYDHPDGRSATLATYHEIGGKLSDRAHSVSVTIFKNAEARTAAGKGLPFPMALNAACKDLSPADKTAVKAYFDSDKTPADLAKLSKEAKSAVDAVRGMIKAAEEGAQLVPAPRYCRFIPQAERDKLDSSDFAGPHQSYPIAKPADVASAASLVGKAADSAQVKSRIISIAYRKGPAFVSQLPESWKRAESKAAEAGLKPAIVVPEPGVTVAAAPIVAEAGLKAAAASPQPCGCKNEGVKSMTAEQKAEAVKTLVNCKHSGFTVDDTAMLETASDARIESFLVAAEARKTEVETARTPKTLSEEDFMAVAPPALKSLISRQQRQETELKAELVTALKAAQEEYSEAELAAMPVEGLERLARMTRIEVKPDFSGRGLPRALAAGKENDVYANPPDPYKLALEARKAN